MRYLILALVFCAALPVPASAQADGEIIALADAFDQAQLRQDRSALEKMVASDLVFIDGSGRRLGKQDFIAGWLEPDTRYDPLRLTDRVVVRLGPNTAIVSAETVLAGQSTGRRFASHFRYSDTFRRVRGKRQAVFIQVTRVPTG